MSDGIVIPIDGDTSKIDAKLRRVKRNAAEAGKSMNAAQAGSIAARMGGAGGGIVGRMTGGFAMGGVAGVAGIGMTAAGLVLNRVVESSARAVEMEAGRLSLRRTLSHARVADATAMQAHSRSIATSQLSAQQKVGRLLSRGGNLDIIKTKAARYRISNDDAMDLTSVSQDTGVSEDELQQAMNTNEWGSYDDAANDIRKHNGVRNALAMKRGLNTSDAYAMSEVDRQLREGGGQIANVRKVRSAGNKAELAGLEALTNGSAAAAAQADADATLTAPESQYDKALNAAKDAAEAQFMAAQKQSRFVALFAGIFGSGTETRKALQSFQTLGGGQ